MIDLSTAYMGLPLKNPILVASSRLTSAIERIMECEKAGAGAVVLKSLFEEQIYFDSSSMIGDMNLDAYTDAYDFLRESSKDFHLNSYLELVENAKSRTEIPVIASLNCVSPGNWLEYAEKLQSVGADALEMNIFIMPSDTAVSGIEIENIYKNILREVKKRISIPVAFKVGSHFSGMAAFFSELAEEGVDGLVLFNRFYKPDIDIEKLNFKPQKLLSTSEEMALSLQWIAMLSGKINADLSASTGIHDASGVIKQLLAGAKTIQLCSTLMKNGTDYIGTIVREIESWMDRKNFKTIADFNGLLSRKNTANPEIYERSQYIKAIVGIE